MVINIIGIGEILWDVFPDEERFGGAPCNFACSAAELAKNIVVRSANEHWSTERGTTLTVHFVGAVGSDAYGDRGRHALQERGVATNALQTKVAATGRVTVKLDATGAASYVFDPTSAWDFLSWSAELETLAGQCHAVCFGTLGQRGAQSKETIRRFVTQVPRESLRVLDINLRAPYFDASLIRESLALANVLKLNEAELPVVAGVCNCSGSEREVLVQLAQMFSLHSVSLTKGEAGAILYSGGKWSELPGQRVQVVDTVGAGDAYTASMVLGLLRGDDVELINRQAIAVASYVCTQPGATMPFPARLSLHG
ncbi:MAG: hypothetical protein JNL67_04825 [Planctomycetaceae bacterium]|nr:hypothetical protein [Planctomycetaceae bacterium]